MRVRSHVYRTGSEVAGAVLLTMLRHGEPARAGSHDPADPPLSELGRAQARAAAPWAAEFDVVYASPMRRAHETAVLAAAPGVEVGLDDGMVEFDHGHGYVHFEDGVDVYRRYLAGDLSAWGTTLDAFSDRVEATLGALAERHHGERVLVVCHGGVVNAVACRALGVPERVRVLAPDYCSFHWFERVGGRWAVRSLNDVAPAALDN